MLRLTSILFASLLWGCGTPSTDETGTTAAAPPAGTDLSSYDLPLLVTLPDAQLTGGSEPQLGWREEEGWFQVNAGDAFRLRISEEPGDFARLKADLERDPIREARVIKEEPGLLVYRLEFPAEPGLVFVHFYQVITAGDRAFVVESDGEGRFTEADVERMRTSVTPKADPA
ncbi:MAG: hypothetical protein JNM31_03460 [Flavobacteriales bacterium]|nr:hypothetical protein [Flavobacteriales bacterium]